MATEEKSAPLPLPRCLFRALEKKRPDKNSASFFLFYSLMSCKTIFFFVLRPFILSFTRTKFFFGFSLRFFCFFFPGVLLFWSGQNVENGKKNPSCGADVRKLQPKKKGGKKISYLLQMKTKSNVDDKTDDNDDTLLALLVMCGRGRGKGRL